MRAPSFRSTGAPDSTRSTRRRRSTRGGAPANSSASAASTRDPDPSRSVDRPAAPELSEKPTRDEWDGAHDLARQEIALDHDDVRGNRSSTDGARDYPRDPARQATRLPERDPFLAAVGSLRNFVLHCARTATWTFTLSCAAACASLQLPLPNDNTIARALFLLSALSAGALLGKWIDRRTRRKT